MIFSAVLHTCTYIHTYIHTEPHSSPMNVQILSTDKRSVTMSWEPPLLRDRNGIITYYLIVIHNLDFGVSDIRVNVSGSVLNHTVAGLEEYSRHECTLAAGTVIGRGPYSTPTEFATLQDGKYTCVYITVDLLCMRIMSFISKCSFHENY